MNLAEEAEKLKAAGLSEGNAQARLCQDIILKGIATSPLSRSVTVKGGVVMRNLSGSARRATQDVDIDFIRYSLDDASIDRFVSKINNIPGISISRTGSIEELKHQDYKGKRIHIVAADDFGNHISSKVDIGVHTDLDLKQAEFCFDICFSEDGASLLMNTPAQMITEKLKSLLRFGSRSTRYKDVFDVYYLLEIANPEVLRASVAGYIYDDDTLAVNNAEDVIGRIGSLFKNRIFINGLERSGKNWLNVETEAVLDRIKDYLWQVL